MNADELRAMQAPIKERYCVVHQTLRNPPSLQVSLV